MTIVLAVALTFNAVLVSSCSASESDSSRGAIDGPVLSASSSREIATMDARLNGRLVLDADHGCLVLETEGADAQAVLWPAGTSWESESAVVVLPDGEKVPVGDFVSAGGGSAPLSRVESLAGSDVHREAQRCVGNDGMVAVLQVFT